MTPKERKKTGECFHPVYAWGRWLRNISPGQVLPPAAHAGLVFERFPFVWWVEVENDQSGSTEVDHSTWDTSSWTWDSARRKNREQPLAHKFLDKFCKVFGQDTRPARNLLSALHQRLCIIRRALDGFEEFLTSQWRFVTGLGAPHPLENGFLFDRAVGVPYLPGSSVKGVARAGAELARDETNDEDARNELKLKIKRIFGPEGDEAKKESRIGTVIFFDAYPTEWPKLDPDIMNPHYGDYYTGKEDKPPADYLRPNPIFFLTVAPTTPFRFVVAPRLPYAKEDAAQAMAWLKIGLQTLGAGAKTAAGYGGFDTCPPIL